MKADIARLKITRIVQCKIFEMPGTKIKNSRSKNSRNFIYYPIKISKGSDSRKRVKQWLSKK